MNREARKVVDGMLDMGEALKAKGHLDPEIDLKEGLLGFSDRLQVLLATMELKNFDIKLELGWSKGFEDKGDMLLADFVREKAAERLQAFFEHAVEEIFKSVIEDMVSDMMELDEELKGENHAK